MTYWVCLSAISLVNALRPIQNAVCVEDLIDDRGVLEVECKALCIGAHAEKACDDECVDYFHGALFGLCKATWMLTYL